jgi:hypothetical protein
MNRHARHIPGTLGALTFASAVSLATLGIVGAPTDRAPDARPLVGDFTGEVVTDGPVYRLPTVHVVADRSVELARIDRDERAAARPLDCVSATSFPHVVEEVA